MPGPMSAPNGDHKLTDRPRENGRIPVTGKTALKRGQIKHKANEDRVRRIRKEMNAWRRNEMADEG